MELKAEELNGQGDWYFERGAYKLFKGDTPFEDRKLVQFFYNGLPLAYQ